MTTRRLLREVVSTVLGIPPASVFEAVRHVADKCPTDGRGPSGSRPPNPETVTWHLLAALATLPGGLPLNRWPEGTRAKGIRARAERWHDLASIPAMASTTGNPPMLFRAICAANMPLGLALNYLFQELLKPEVIALFGDGVEGDTRFGDDGITLGIHGGDHHSFATLDFSLRNGATLKAVFRHPADSGRREPKLVVRYALGLRGLAALAGVAAGARGVAEVARASVQPVRYEPPVLPPRVQRRGYVPGMLNRRPPVQSS